MKKYKKVKKNNGNYMETEHEIILAIKKEAKRICFKQFKLKTMMFPLSLENIISYIMNF